MLFKNWEAKYAKLTQSNNSVVLKSFTKRLGYLLHEDQIWKLKQLVQAEEEWMVWNFNRKGKTILELIIWVIELN